MDPVDEITLPKVPDDDLDDIPPQGLAMARPSGDHKAVIDARQWRQAVQAYLATINFCRRSGEPAARRLGPEFQGRQHGYRALGRPRLALRIGSSITVAISE